MSIEEFNMERRQDLGTKPTLERHLQTIIAGVGMALLIWVGYTLTRSVETVARIDEKVKNMETAIAELKGDLKLSVNSRYTWQDAQADKRAIEFKFESLNTRVTKLESRCETHSNLIINSKLNKGVSD